MPQKSLSEKDLFSVGEIEEFLRSTSPLFRLVDRMLQKKIPRPIKSALYRTHRTLVRQGAVVFLSERNLEFLRDAQGNLRIGSSQHPQWRVVPDHARRICFPWA